MCLCEEALNDFPTSSGAKITKGQQGPDHKVHSRSPKVSYKNNVVEVEFSSWIIV